MGEATRFWTRTVRAGLGLPPPQPERGLFLSPRDTEEPSGVADWQAIEAAAIDHGLTVIHPATLSLAERIATFGEAECLLGFDGAALIEACVFAPPGIPVCAIRGSTASGVRLAGLAPALGHRIGFVFGTGDPEDPTSPATVSGAALQSALTALLLLKRQAVGKSLLF
jgi:capsular polysaccharide biosynthesis protein